jgi:hypothetical protein
MRLYQANGMASRLPDSFQTHATSFGFMAPNTYGGRFRLLAQRFKKIYVAKGLDVAGVKICTN